MNAYVHHTPVPVDYSSLKEYNNLRRSYGRCVDQLIAVSSGVRSTYTLPYRSWAQTISSMALPIP